MFPYLVIILGESYALVFHDDNSEIMFGITEIMDPTSKLVVSQKLKL